MTHLLRKAFSEFLGTVLLLTAVVGSSFYGAGIISQVPLIALIGSSLATVFALGCIIFVFGSISGGYFNPVVTFAEFVAKRLDVAEFVTYIVAQFAGGVVGVMLANYTFKQNVVGHSVNPLKGMNFYVSEAVVTAGLIIILQLLIHQYNDHLAPIAIPAWIGAGYLFSSSTGFANPAAVVGRMFTNAPGGIEWKSGLNFIAAEVLGAVIGIVVVYILTAGDDDFDDLSYFTEEEFVEATDHTI